MGRGTRAWEQLSGMLTDGEVSGVPELYGADALYLEPYNPPHRGNLLIEAYLKDWLAGKEEIAIEARHVIEAGDASAIAVEWAISYTAAGRRWHDLPRASFLAFGDDERITYHRDYT